MITTALSIIRRFFDAQLNCLLRVLIELRWQHTNRIHSIIFDWLYAMYTEKAWFENNNLISKKFLIEKFNKKWIRIFSIKIIINLWSDKKFIIYTKSIYLMTKKRLTNVCMWLFNWVCITFAKRNKNITKRLRLQYLRTK